MFLTRHKNGSQKGDLTDVPAVARVSDWQELRESLV